MKINYTLKRSNRKTVAIHIRDGHVEVRAPHRTSIEHIEGFIASKEKWIKDKLAHSLDKLVKRQSHSVDYGSLLLYRGKSCPITAREGKVMGFDEGEGCFYMPPDLTPEQIKASCIQIYKLLAKRDINEKVKHYSEIMELQPQGVKINSAKTRWGSCSSKRLLNFSWMLIMAEDEVIDYIVIHELAHLHEMNHSHRFWEIVEKYNPDYESRRHKLKELQHKLAGEDWT